MARKSSEKELMRVPQKRSTVHAEHPYKNSDNHDLLLQYCKDRIDLSRNTQSFFRDRFTEIDREFYGYLNLSPEDKKRKIAQIQGRSSSPTEMRAAFVASQMFRMVTFLVSVFSPDSGIYEVVTNEKEQPLGSALTTLMNNHAIKGAYFRQQAKFFLDALKYNVAGFEADWFAQTGNKIVDQGGKAKVEETTLFEGNVMKCLDMYNTFWSPMVEPMDVYHKAEYAGYLDLCSTYELKKQVQDGEIFNTKDLWARPSSLNRVSSWYHKPPAIRYDISVEEGGSGGYDWVHILSQGMQSNATLAYYERATIYIRLIPTEFGLVESSQARSRNKFEIWKIQIINGTHIVQCKHVPNVHDYIPMFFGRPMEDNMGNQSKSATEMMSMFQVFANFLLNTHIKSARKNLYDITIFDPTVVNLSQIDDDVAARIPMLPGGYGKNPKDSVWRPDSHIDTKETMEQIQKLLELMEYIFPTRLLQQVGQIDRAIGEQIAALLAAAYRDSWKLARLLDEQAMSPMRFVLVSNIKQFQPTMQVTTPTGAKVDISPTILRNTDFEFKIGEGLKMIDRLTLMSALGDIINRLLQSQAIQGVDALALINWYASLAGSDTDLTRFRIAQPAQTGQQLPGQPAAAAPAGVAAPTV